MKSFAKIFSEHTWKPILNCPGRYIGGHSTKHLNFRDLSGCTESIYKSSCCRDIVYCAKISGGGIISYLQSDGSLIHTLCDESGYERKMLEILIDAQQLDTTNSF